MVESPAIAQQFSPVASDESNNERDDQHSNHADQLHGQAALTCFLRVRGRTFVGLHAYRVSRAQKRRLSVTAPSAYRNG
jgi:hypothetical protein